MGTNNLTIVHSEGEYKIAQYGQWDGYPSGQGLTILGILKLCKTDVLRDRVLHNIIPANQEDKDRELIEIGNSMGISDIEDQVKSGWVSHKVGSVFNSRHPELSRDTGGKILNLIIELNENEKLQHANQIDFAAYSLFCEWAYVVDLDTNTFEVYKGFNKTPLTPQDRFYWLESKSDDGFHPVKLVKSYPIGNLPSEEQFLAELEPPLDED